MPSSTCITACRCLCCLGWRCRWYLCGHIHSPGGDATSEAKHRQSRSTCNQVRILVAPKRSLILPRTAGMLTLPSVCCGTRALGFSFSTISRVAVLNSWSLGYCAALCVKAGDSHLGDSGVSQNPALFTPVLCCDVSAKPASLKLSCRQHLQSWAKI